MPDFMMFLLWCSLICYSCSFIPQIITNFRHKSTHGLSDLFLILYSYAYGSLLYYVFCLDLVLPYKVMIPFEVFLNTILIGQRFYYHGWKKNLFFSRGVVVSVLVFIAALPWVICKPASAGIFFGWMATVIFSINQMPQVAKLYKAKSTTGFSFLFVSFLALGMLLELIGGLAKNLPLPTIIMAVRGICVYCIFCLQFWLYRHNSKH